MSFKTVDYWMDSSNSTYTASDRSYVHIDDVNVCDFRDVNRMRTSQSTWSCLNTSYVNYYPSNKSLRRAPIQLPTPSLNIKDCSDMIGKVGRIGYAKVKDIVKPIFWSLIAIGVCGVIPLGTKFSFVCVLAGFALSKYPFLMKKVSLIAAKKIIDTQENIEQKLSSFEKRCIDPDAIIKIAEEDFKYFSYNQMLRKYGNLQSWKSSLSLELKEAVLSKVDQAKKDIKLLVNSITNEKLKNQIIKINGNIKIENFRDSFEEIIKTIHQSKEKENNLSRSFFSNNFDILDSFGDILRIQITEKSSTVDEIYNIFTSKSLAFHNNPYLEKVIINSQFSESGEVLEIKKENTSLKFWESYSSGNLSHDFDINDFLEVLAEAHKYNVTFLLNQCLKEIRCHIKNDNVTEIRTYGEDCQCEELVKLCNDWCA